MQNEAQYDLDREAAKISALSSNNLDKYEYLTALGKIFNKGLGGDNKKEGLFQRLENIKNKNQEQLQAIKDQGEEELKKLKNVEESKTLKVINEISKKDDKANKILLDVKKINDELDTVELVCAKIDGTKYDFNGFSFPLKFVEKCIIMKLL